MNAYLGLNFIMVESFINCCRNWCSGVWRSQAAFGNLHKSHKPSSSVTHHKEHFTWIHSALSLYTTLSPPLSPFPLPFCQTAVITMESLFTSSKSSFSIRSYTNGSLITSPVLPLNFFHSSSPHCTYCSQSHWWLIIFLQILPCSSVAFLHALLVVEFGINAYSLTNFDMQSNSIKSSWWVLHCTPVEVWMRSNNWGYIKLNVNFCLLKFSKIYITNRLKISKHKGVLHMQINCFFSNIDNVLVSLFLSNLQKRRQRWSCGWAAVLSCSCPAAASCQLPGLYWSKASSPSSRAGVKRRKD